MTGSWSEVRAGDSMYTDPGGPFVERRGPSAPADRPPLRGTAAPGPREWRLATRLLLTGLLLGTAALTWVLRLPRIEAPVLVAAPLVSTPIAEARPAATGRRLEVRGRSEVWSAPPLAPLPPPPAGALPLPDPARIAATPAGEVDRWVLRWATGGRAGLGRSLERMTRYEPWIRHVLAREGLPGDLVYLALIESDFLPSATSRSGAAGIWQLMPATARGLGLEVSEYVDERRDPVRSTEAAARHLRWLHRHFGSWHLAAAAYNAGGGRVGGVLQELLGPARGEERHYWMARPYLPAETQDYVPKLLAASRVARFRGHYGLDSLRAQPPLSFREISVPGGTALERVAEAVGADAGELRELNPHLVRGVTPPGRPWPVRVPAPSEETPAPEDAPPGR